MGQTTILEETFDEFNEGQGDVKKYTRRTVQKSSIQPTDEFIKVSKYLNTIFAFNNIPLNLVGISLLLAQRMEFKTNIIYLLKDDKEEMAEMLNIKLNTIEKLLSDCKKYNIIKSIARGKYEVNSFLFSTGSIAETRDLQAHFDFENNTMITQATQKNLITGDVVRKSVINKKNKKITG